MNIHPRPRCESARAAPAPVRWSIFFFFFNFYRRHAPGSVPPTGVGVASFPCAAPARGHFQTLLASFRSRTAASFSFESDSIQKRWIFVRGQIWSSIPVVPGRPRSLPFAPGAPSVGFSIRCHLKLVLRMFSIPVAPKLSSFYVRMPPHPCNI